MNTDRAAEDRGMPMPPKLLLQVIARNDASVYPPARSVFTGHVEAQGSKTWYYFIGEDTAFRGSISGGEFWLDEIPESDEACGASTRGL